MTFLRLLLPFRFPVQERKQCGNPRDIGPHELTPHDLTFRPMDGVWGVPTRDLMDAQDAARMQ